MTLPSPKLVALACILALGAVTSSAGLTSAVAQTTTTAPAAPAAAPLVIGILDGDVVLKTSETGKSLRQQYEQKDKAFQADAAKQEDALRAQMQNLQSQRASLQPQDYDAKQLAIRQQADKLRQDLIAKRKALNQAAEKARGILIQNAQKALQEVAQQRGMTLVIDKSATHLSLPGWDITNEVLQRLNKTLPALKM